MSDFIVKFLDWILGILVMLVGVIWHQLNSRQDAMHKENQDKFRNLNEALKYQQSINDRVMDKLENQSLRAEIRHNEVMQALHEGLERKADKTGGR